jgi:hypothetical protein
LCQDRAVLCSLEITAAVTVAGSRFHNVHWRPRLELSLDCFICQRTGRTTVFGLGQERALCSGDSEPHDTPARIAAFDHTSEKERTVLRAVIDYWWAPFVDAKRDREGATLPRTPWVRLALGYLCPDQQSSGEFAIQSNLVRPYAATCSRCSEAIGTSEEAPRIRLLS